jgi:enediyne biosynthesis protein E4
MNSAPQVTAGVGADRVGFERLSPERTGIGFTNLLTLDRQLLSQILPNGSGVAAGDVDGDGWVDLYFCGLDSDNRLYRNLGDGSFEDITAAAGVGWPGRDATGAAFADLDGDGDLDLVVNSIGAGTGIFLNDGQGRFTETGQGWNIGRGGTSMALADLDGDGDLDLYVANYRATTYADRPLTRFTVRRINDEFTVTLVDGRPLTDPELTNRFNFKFILEGGGRGRLAHEENGEPDLILFNDGHGRFEAGSFTDGRFLGADGQALREPPYDWGLSVAVRDVNGDGWPDIYVCNDFGSPDRLWLGQGQGRFQAAPPLALRQTSLASMAVDFADLNRDGWDDFLVVEMLSRDHGRRLTQRNLMRGDLAPAGLIDARPQYARNVLQLNRGDGTFAEIAQYAGIEATEWSWTPVFLDVDLDGYEDLLVGNGFERDNMNLDAIAAYEQARSNPGLSPVEILRLRRLYPRLDTPNVAFRNLGNLRFAEVSQAWGFDTPTISQGLCLADLDNDGDLDLIVNNMNNAAAVYRNVSGAPRLAVRLRGLPPNTRGIGARIRVFGGSLPMQSQEMMSGGRYLSSDDTMRVFAAGHPTNQLRVEVDWPSGRRSVQDRVAPGQLLVDETNAREVDRIRPDKPEPWFEDRTTLLAHRHVDQPYDDFARQPLLGKNLSQLGPGVAWFDCDGDGRDDLIVGSGKGGRLAIFRNDGQGGFNRFNAAELPAVESRDQTGLLAWHSGRGRRELLVGTASYEHDNADAPAVTRIELGQKPQPLQPAVLAHTASVGPLAMADFDGDGHLDLFVGGRVVAGRYPAPASSLLLRSQDGEFIPHAPASHLFHDLGLVSGAVWSDLNSDGWPELVLACEWGALRIFRNEQGALTTWDPPIQAAPGDSLPPGANRLSHLTGWWNGVASGDFDGDGALDLVASNWGLNSRYERYGSSPVRVHFGDYDSDERLELMESGFVDARKQWVPDRPLDFYQRSMPFLARHFRTFQSWGETDIQRALGDYLARSQKLEAAWRASTVLLNRHTHFEVVSLPLEAQLSPAFAVAIADADGDGSEDIFLSQNFFGVDLETSRYDAGRGLWLRGDGRGRFEAVPGHVSGVKVYGEGRGAALADYDGDGRVDLVVAQNRGETRLYRNRVARPGLRVRLERSDGGEPAIGAVARLKFGEKWGPARELQAGSGYWSQNSPVLVLARPTQPTQLWVRWPGGRSELLPVPSGALEITARLDATTAP